MDVVAHRDPDRPPRSGAGLAVGLLAAVVAAALAVSALRDEPADRAAPAATGTPYTPAPEQSPVAPQPPADLGPPPVDAAVTTAARGRVVVVLPDGVRAVDLATGESVAIPVDGPVRHALTVGSSVVLYGGNGLGDFPPPPTPVYVVDPALRITRLGEFGAVVPDADGTGVWVTTWQARQGTVRHLSLAGRRIGRPWTIDETDVVRAAVRGGLLLVADVQAGGLDVWDPARNQRLHREPYSSYVAGTPSRALIGEPECAPTCGLTWWDAPRDWAVEERPCRCGTLRPPFDAYFHVAAMSPDGRWVALQDGADRNRVAVCAVTTGRCVRPPNAVKDGPPFEPAWTADGTLVLATEPLLGQLLVWRPGWTELRQTLGYHPAESVAALGS